MSFSQNPPFRLTAGLYSILQWSTAIALCGSAFVAPAGGVQSDEPVRFDVPALLGVCQGTVGPDLLADERLIEIVVPITCVVSQDQRSNFTEFRFDVQWQRSIYPLADYSPRTLMQSPIEGLVAVENRAERNLKVGVDTKSPMLQLQPSAHVAGESVNSNTTSFGEIPQHEMLLASGTIQRGTGAFFRYHPSRQFALEGGREVTLLYRVPEAWRAGLLRVDCTAHGHRKGFAGFREPVSASAVFMVPIYLLHDVPARDCAVDYIRSEQRLRQVWDAAREASLARPKTFLAQFRGTVGRVDEQALAPDWATKLIYAPRDELLAQDRRLLPDEMLESAETFLAARAALVRLSLPGEPAPEAPQRQSAWQTRSPTSVVE